jgi:hypothetical protein
MILEVRQIDHRVAAPRDVHRGSRRYATACREARQRPHTAVLIEIAERIDR